MKSNENWTAIWKEFKLAYDPRVRKSQIKVLNLTAEQYGLEPINLPENLKRWPMDLYKVIFIMKDTDSVKTYNLIKSYFEDKSFFEGFKTGYVFADANAGREARKQYDKGREDGIKQADEMIDRLIMDGTLLKVAKRLEGITPEQMALLNKMAGGSSSEKSLVRQLLEV